MWKWLDNALCKIGIHNKILIRCGHNDSEWCWYCVNCSKTCFTEEPALPEYNDKLKSSH
jgi:hypothetical protein